MTKEFIMFAVLVLLIGLSSEKLLSVIEVNRHGARDAENFNSLPIQSFFGLTEKLTTNGYRQHQLLGNYMKKKYVKSGFINPDYTEGDFQIISTPTQRTVFSANGFISGLYPGHVVKTSFNQKNLKLFNNDILPVKEEFEYQEVPLKVLSWNEISLFLSWECKLDGEKIKKKSKDKTKYPDLLKVTEAEKKKTAKILAQVFGAEETLKRTDLDEFLFQMTKFVKTHYYHYGLDMEKEIGSLASNTIKKLLINKRYNPRTKDSKMLRLGASEFFVNLIKNFESFKGNEKTFPKYTVYSSHDKGIINILTNIIAQDYLEDKVKNSLYDKEAYDFLLPPFASHLNFELHYDENENEYYVIIVYNGEALNIPLRDGSNITGGKIKFSAFKSFLESRIQKQWNEVDCSEVKDEGVNNFPSVTKKSQPSSKFLSYIS